MSSDIAIRVQDVSKHYLIYRRPDDRLKQMVLPKLRGIARLPEKRYYTDFAAVQGVNLEIRKGQTLGIIGRNGSGKSTLLQMICGTLQPSSGSVEVNGRIAALLELGAGFNPEFTGRENVRLNCAILGLTAAETEQRFEAIERFADIGIFIDQPVKTYSSGMYVRLAFAVAINVDPDILVVDEALAVGDEAFQRKCFARIEQIRESGATILFVSHGAQTIVQLCDRAILMDGGEVLMDGEPKPVVQQYQRLINAAPETAQEIRIEITEGKFDLAKPEAASVTEAPAPPPMKTDADLFDAGLVANPVNLEKSQLATISDVRLETDSGRALNQSDMGDKITLRYRICFNERIENVFTGMSVRTISGLKLFGASTRLVDTFSRKTVEAGEVWDVSFPFDCNLTPGVYFFTVAVGISQGNAFQHLHRIQDAVPLRVKWQPQLVATGYIDAKIEPTIVSTKEALV